MNKNFMTILTVAAFALTTGCVTAGTWVNGYYVDGPLCTVCDGTRVIAHTYGTTVCTHCDGTGIEPPETPVVVENVIVDTWCPALPPPRYHRPRPIVHRDPPRRGGGHRNGVRPARPAGGARPKAAVRPARAAKPTGGGAHAAKPHGGGHRR